MMAHEANMRLFLVFAPFLAVGCTEYGFSTPGVVAKATAGEGEDTAWYAQDHVPLDTGEADGTDPIPQDTAPAGDACYEPEDGYDLNPAARIVVDNDTIPIQITFLGSDSGYQDELWVDAPISTKLLDAWTEAPGNIWDIGPFAVGTEIIFGTYVTNTGDRWQTGPASRNVDGVVHGASTYEGNCRWQVGFEDLYGGGDMDFNDVIFRVAGPLRQED